MHSAYLANFEINEEQIQEGQILNKKIWKIFLTITTQMAHSMSEKFQFLN
jgi:hypothetical protein